MPSAKTMTSSIKNYAEATISLVCFRRKVSSYKCPRCIAHLLVRGGSGSLRTRPTTTGFCVYLNLSSFYTLCWFNMQVLVSWKSNMESGDFVWVLGFWVSRWI